MSTYEFRIPLPWSVIAVTSTLALTLFGMVIVAAQRVGGEVS